MLVHSHTGRLQCVEQRLAELQGIAVKRVGITYTLVIARGLKAAPHRLDINILKDLTVVHRAMLTELA